MKQTFKTQEDLCKLDKNKFKIWPTVFNSSDFHQGGNTYKYSVSKNKGPSLFIVIFTQTKNKTNLSKYRVF